jgi:MoaA/NifB/PqqE/SkfB family radical SAM enzyme
MARAVAELRRLRRERTIIENSDAYLALFPDCFAGRPSPLRCRAPAVSLVVDCYGRVFPCVPLSSVDRPVGRVCGEELAGLWKSDVFAAARRGLAGCRACYWNCHTEMNLLYPQRASRRRAAAGGSS